ncbi:hypothetical protein BU17DRAFT_62592 [Hysterangium stoloniferum]|nr:hypothetical protein BU17DRAFT_62592 [Hysterangium stoloniferum]
MSSNIPIRGTFGDPNDEQDLIYIPLSLYARFSLRWPSTGPQVRQEGGPSKPLRSLPFHGYQRGDGWMTAHSLSLSNLLGVWVETLLYENSHDACGRMFCLIPNVHGPSGIESCHGIRSVHPNTRHHERFIFFPYCQPTADIEDNFILASGIGIIVLSLKVTEIADFSKGSPQFISYFGSLSSVLRIFIPTHLSMLFATSLWVTIFVVVKLCTIGHLLEQSKYTWKTNILIFVGESGVFVTVITFVSLSTALLATNLQECIYGNHQFARSNSDPESLASDKLDMPIASASPSPQRHSGMAPITFTTIVDARQTLSRRSAGHIETSATEGIMPSHTSRTNNGGPAAVSPLGKTAPIPLLNRKPRNLTVAVPEPLTLATDHDFSTPPPAPRTPVPPAELPVPFEAHFPRLRREERFSQQTFNPSNSNAGQGMAVYTKFGSSGLAITLEKGKNVDMTLAREASPKMPTSRERDRRRERIPVNPPSSND